MEPRDFLRPILAGLVAVGLIVLLIVLIFKALPSGGTATGPLDITKYASNDNASVTLLADAPTRYDGEHYQVKITVSSLSNEIDIIQGYDGTVVQQQTYPNNSAAFAVFLQTLQDLGYSNGKTSKLDYRGYCATGERYLFSLSTGTKDDFTYWHTSCGQGDFNGQASAILEQFKRQIPEKDFIHLTKDTHTGL